MTTLLAPPRIDDATRRQVLGGAGLLLTAACGRDAPPTGAPDATRGFPVTIDHALGATTIPRAPERVVALGDQDADIAVALGTQPWRSPSTPSQTSGKHPG